MKKGIESLGRIRAQGIALLIVTFAIGLLAGVAIDRVRTARRVADRLPPEGGMMTPWRESFLPPMFERLNLTSEQRTRIREIMERNRPRTEELLDQMLPRLRAVTDSVRLEIRAVLTAEQAAQLDSMVRAMGHRRGRMGSGLTGRRMRGPPPSPER